VGSKLLLFGVLLVILVESKKNKSVTLLSILKIHSSGDMKILAAARLGDISCALCPTLYATYYLYQPEYLYT
jgi:hypothetical protein